ncbi:hypothetical protein Gotri_024198 [Gossypium trilobum]|uniref:ELM2 domain-containing protein n=1 Tax=Gossypium trilobum TaxID=34281 RepID=A0A7J9DLD8_9ROSI|nr:hypothetical protein [Gossypium trilobum]
MVHKRPFIEDVFEVSCKQPRQAEHSNQWVLSSEPLFPEDAAPFSNASGEGRFTNVNTKCDEKLANAIDTEHQGNPEDLEANIPGCIAISSLGTSSTHEEDLWPDEPLHMPSFAECFNPERPVRTVARLEDIYSILLQYPPRKPVLVGPNYQADIPEWDSQVTRNASNCEEVSETASRYEREMVGTCIIPIPALESSAYDEKVGHGRTNCSCEDKDSVRCVRQHILEAREELRKSLGHERFMELGFYDMGEVVAEKWSEHEEQLFHKVVFYNPASLGRNFWGSLASVFPHRTKADIVSYYFNVFMLRKRSEQNRCESMSIDSDNDEWQGTDDSGNNEAEFSDEDEDSVVESPVCDEDFAHHHSKENGLCVLDEDIADEICDNQSSDFAIKDSETYGGKLFRNCGSDLMDQVHGNTLDDVAQGEREVQDDSCTSSDTGGASQETHVPADNFNGGNRGYVLEPCYPKGWDTRYPTCQTNFRDDS